MNDQPQLRSLNVSLAGQRDTKAWDDYVGGHPDSFYCLTTAWRDVVEAVYGHRSYYLMAREGTALRGVLPLFLVKSRLFGRVLASGPFASAGAVCADDDAAGNALVERAIKVAREQRVGYLELKSLPKDGLPKFGAFTPNISTTGLGSTHSTPFGVHVSTKTRALPSGRQNGSDSPWTRETAAWVSSMT